jgi:hypothetical protein
MGFRLEKLYADLITADGTVCVAYQAWLDAWGIRRAFAGLELYWPDGTRDVIQARPHPGPLSRREGALDLSFDVPGGPFVLTFGATHPAWTPAGGAPCDALRWSVKVPRAQVVGRWMGDPRRPELRGVGYADWVEMDRPARALKLGLLRWGRAHLPDGTLVYSTVQFRSGRSWQRAALWSDGRPAQWSVVGVHETESGTTVELPGHPERLLLAPRRELHVGHAIDRERFPRALRRMLSSAVTGPAVEKRSLSSAGWASDCAASGSWSLHETVRFGAPALP